MNLIVTCGCEDTDGFAKAAFKLLFPGTPLPAIVSQPRDFTPWQEEMDTLFKSGVKFAYYLNDTEMWDLKKGVRLA